MRIFELSRLMDAAATGSTSSKPFETHVIAFAAYKVDGARKPRDQGVTDAIVGFRDPCIGEDDTPVQERIDILRRFADDVIAKV